MPKFFNSDMADLTQQLRLSPRRLRLQQIHGIETLLGLIELDRAYPFGLVCYHVTKYRQRRPSTGYSIPGKALVSDLVTMAEVLSRNASIPVGDLQEPYKTHGEVADVLQVSTKTIRRWRDRGLMGIRVVFDDGVSRLAFLQRTLDRFVKQNKALVSKGASFTQLTDRERHRIVERAKELVAQRPLKLHAAARIIADEMGRAVETVRYTLRRHDACDAAAALFDNPSGGITCERDQAIWRCREAGEATASIARAFDTTEADIEQVLRRVRAQQWAQKPWDYIHNELFDAPDADALILDVVEPAGPDGVCPKIPKDVPPYLRSLYRTPLLTRQQEQDLFRRYNYLKCKVTRLFAALELDEITRDQFDQVSDLVGRVESIRQRIIRANLRLVVSIAKKHVGWSPNFFEVVSDGNMSLMRAVEKFDFARGTKFSTYATWAIVKNYARSIPEQHYRLVRHVTGQDELLHTTPDHRPAPASESDRQRIKELIAAGMRELTERERAVVTSHFGLGGNGGGVTLECLGRRFGVTKERIRQIEQKAIARLREVLAPSLAQSLPD